MAKRLSDCFSDLEDPRKSNSRHLLSDILFISLCAVTSGAESWEDIELYGKTKGEWLKSMLPLPHGIPSNDTFRRVLSQLNPKVFEQAFRNWIMSLVSDVGGDIIPIDGKRIRGAFRAGANNPIHQVSAWSCSHQVVLGQVRTDSKSNEITAIPELLKWLEIKGSVVTIDAMGTQKAIAKQIVEKEGDYVLALKGNQGHLHQDVIDYYEHIEQKVDAKATVTTHETLDKEHGRLETRRCTVITDVDWLEDREKWAGLNSLLRVESTTEHLKQNRISRETRYYISSLKPTAEAALNIIRAHWQIENSLHWVLDVSFAEDACTIHDSNGAENFSLLRKIALALLKKDPTNGSIKGKRKRAGWNNDFLLSLIGQLYPK